MPVDVFARIAGSCVAGVFDLRTTVYLPFADAVTPSSRKDGLPLRLIRRRNEKTTSADVSGVPSAKWTFLLQAEDERLRVLRRRPRLDEHRHRMRDVAALVGEERVEGGPVDDRGRRLERALRVGRLDLERTVDHERPLAAEDAPPPLTEVAPLATAAVASATVATSATLPSDSQIWSFCPPVDGCGLSSLFDVPRRFLVGERAPPGARAARWGSGASTRLRAPRRASAAAALPLGSARTRRGSADGTGSRSAAARDRAPRPAAPRAGSRCRPGAARPRSAPPCTDAAAGSRAAASAPSRPSRRGTSPRRRRRRGGRSRGRARSAAG